MKRHNDLSYVKISRRAILAIGIMFVTRTKTDYTETLLHLLTK